MFDIFIFASKKEGLGTSIIDALAVGLPIIATKTGGIPEIIKNDENGILVEPQNYHNLADDNNRVNWECKEKQNYLSKLQKKAQKIILLMKPLKKI